MSESIKIQVPPDLVNLVRDSHPSRRLKLTNETVSLIAAYLFAYQNSEAAKDAMRKSQNEKHQERLLNSLLNSARDTESRLYKIMADPILSQQLLNAYKSREPVEVAYAKPRLGALAHDIYVGNVDVPENPESALLEIRGHLSILVNALNSLNPKPSPNSTNKKTQEALYRLVNNLDEVIKTYIGDDCPKKTRASYIADYLMLIDLYLADKTIQNYLS